MKRLLCVLFALLLPAAMFVPALAEIYTVGSSGNEITAIQARLLELGYTETETDGIYGEGTASAVASFQLLNDLLETGMADETTVRVLMSDDAVAYTDGMDVYESGVYEDNACVMMSSTGYYGKSVDDSYFDTREYTVFAENGFHSTAAAPLSTFAADVDTASWAQIRQYLLRGEEVPADAVRIEEMLNYFSYDYKTPENGEPFGVTMEMGDCPWQEGNKLLLIGLQTEEIKTENVPKNLVFLIDVSGSMDEPDKLPLVRRAFLLLLEQLNENDTVSIVTYASNDEVVLDGGSAADRTQIMDAIEELTAGGSTNGAAGICTAYDIAADHYIDGGINRVILATDGDLNVGITSEGELARLVSEKRDTGIYLTALGVGGNNYKDNRMEALADYGNGTYHYIDSIYEARRALVTEAGGTFNTVAKDVKLQLDMNPAYIKGYRLIGYEDRLLDAEDFADDSVDGGEIGSGHRVTALYEIVPADSDFDFGVTTSKYSKDSTDSAEWLTLSIRAKAPDSDISTLYTYPLADPDEYPAGENLRFAVGVAEFGMLLRGSEYSGTATYDTALDLLRSCQSVAGDVYKEELVYLTGLAAR